MSQLESTLQQTLVAMLRTLYPEFVINLSLNGISLNGLSPKERAQIIAQMKREGMEPGIQDFSLYLPNSKILNFELKVGKNKQSDDQKLIEEKLIKLGHNYYVIRDVYKPFKLIAEYTDKSYRTKQFINIDIPLNGDTLSDQFLHFPKGTNIADVNSLLKQLYYI